MKLYYLLMLKLILSLLGCGSKAKENIESKTVGSFTIETITQTGKSLNMNYGMVNTSSTSYRILHNRKPISLPNAPEQNTGVPGIWKVYHLVDAPVPALLFGSQSMYLVADRNGTAEVTALKAQYHDFASVQWLDIVSGQPGTLNEVYSSDSFDSEFELKGGRLLAITKSLVLDVKTLEVYPFNVEQRIVDRFFESGFNGALSLSPDSAQVVYFAVADVTDPDPKSPEGLISFNFRNGEAYGLPFNQTEIFNDPGIALTPDYFNHYFEWLPQSNGGYKLTKRENKDIPRIGQLQFFRYKGYVYEISGVGPQLRPILQEFISKAWHLSPEAIIVNDQEYDKSVHFAYDSTIFVLTYDEYSQKVKLEPNDNYFNNAIETSPVWKAGTSFNSMLKEGQFQEYFEK